MGPETDGSAIGHFDCEEHHVQATGGVSLGKTVFGVRGEERRSRSRYLVPLSKTIVSLVKALPGGDIVAAIEPGGIEAAMSVISHERWSHE